MGPFVASTIVKTERRSDGNLTLTVADAAGQTFTLAVAHDVAAVLGHIVADFTDRSARHGNLTKMPKAFAVGGSPEEHVVLLRFEDDIPYGLTPDNARDLGHELLEQAEASSAKPPRRFS